MPKLCIRCGLSLMLALLCLWTVHALAAPDSPAWLARIALSEAGDLPLYAILQAADGRDYALVVADESALQSTAAIKLEPTPIGSVGASAYWIAQPRTAAHVRLPHPPLFDDGRQVLLRATAEEMAALSGGGWAIRPLPAEPIAPQAAAPLALAASDWPNPQVAQMVAQIDSATITTLTGQLSGEWPAIVGGQPYVIATRYTGSGLPIQKATQFVYESLQDLGLPVVYHTWDTEDYSGRNVIGVLTGTLTPTELVLITAHLDSVSNAPSENPAPGADDNASGSVAVLLAARVMRSYAFARTVQFVFFTGEEQGLYGSSFYAAALKSAGKNVVAVYNMDMIAWDAIGDPALNLHTRVPTNPGYAADLAIAGAFTRSVAAYGLSQSLMPHIVADGESASDHSPFWNHGYAALLAIEDDTSDFNAYYHTTNDLLANLNMAYYTAYVKASLATVAHLAEPDSGSRGVVRGVVRDANTGAPIGGAMVLVASRPAVADAAGVYTFTLPAGRYPISATAYEYQTVVASTVVTANTTTQTDFALPAGRLQTTLQGETTFTLPLGVRVPLTLALENIGSWNASWRLQEAPATLWLSEAPTHGVLAAGVRQEVRLYVDTRVPAYVQRGMNRLTLRLAEDTPYALADLPFSLWVYAPESGVTLRGPTAVLPGATWPYTLTYANTGDVATPPLTLSLSLAPALHSPALHSPGALMHPLGALMHPLGALTRALGALTHPLGALAPGQSGTLVFTATVDPGVAWHARLPITATLQGAGLEFDAANNTAVWVAVVADAPLLSFTHSAPTPLGETTRFTNTTVGTLPISYTWAFGDEAHSTQESPTHTYAAIGTYTVTLDARNAVGQGRITQTVEILPPLAPRAAFTTASPIWLGQTSRFTNTTTGYAPAYTWAFGDGVVSHAASPEHRYAAAGTYTVTLSAANQGGTTVATATVTVQGPPQAGFLAPAHAWVGERVIFTNTTTGPGPITYRWDFGDGAPPTTTLHAAHVYTVAGTYAVSLTATNGAGVDGAHYSLVISPGVAPYNVSFTYTLVTPLSSTLQIGQRTRFTATAEGTPPFTCTWDFGDEWRATGNPTEHTYLVPALYTVTLRVSNTIGGALVRQVVVIPASLHYLYLPVIIKSGSSAPSYMR